MDTPLSDIMRVEHIHSEEQLLGAMRRYQGLRTYPGAASAQQRALHAFVEAMAAKGLAVRVQEKGPCVHWQAARDGGRGRAV